MQNNNKHIKNKHKQDNNSEYHYDYNLKQLK